MNGQLKVGIIGEQNPRSRSHLATDDAIRHAGRFLSTRLEINWIATPLLEESVEDVLSGYDGLLCAPGTYKSMKGALNGIRFARESDWPLIGTCGGFQAVVLEYATNVLGISDAEHAEYNPEAPRLVVTPLSCSLAGQVLIVRLIPGSNAYSIYGGPEIVEEYNCNFGLNPEYAKAIDDAGLRVVGVDKDGEARVLELTNHRFFMATLYVPQYLSTLDRPHPLIKSYLEAAQQFKESKHVVAD